MKLMKYNKVKDIGEFRVMTFDEAAALNGGEIWFVSTDGSARRCRVNGKVKRWKRDQSRIEIPMKYGLYDYGTFTAADIQGGRLLVEVFADQLATEGVK